MVTCFWRCLRFLQACVEDWRAGDQLLVPQWKAVFAPQPKKVLPFLNLMMSRDQRRKVA